MGNNDKSINTDQIVNLAQQTGELTGAVNSLRGQVQQVAIASQETARMAQNTSHKVDSIAEAIKEIPKLPDCDELHNELKRSIEKTNKNVRRSFWPTDAIGIWTLAGKIISALIVIVLITLWISDKLHADESTRQKLEMIMKTIANDDVNEKSGYYPATNLTFDKSSP